MKRIGKRALALFLAIWMVASVCPLWLISFPATAADDPVNETMTEYCPSLPQVAFYENGMVKTITVEGKTYNYGTYSEKLDGINHKILDEDGDETGLRWIYYGYGTNQVYSSWKYGIIITTESSGVSGTVPDDWDAYKPIYGLSLNEIYVCEGVTGIGNNVFKNQNSITKVFLAPSVKELGDSCFAGCIELLTINLSHVESIGAYCFFESTALCDKFNGSLLNSKGGLYGGLCIATADGAVLRKIGAHAFRGCNTLRKIYVGSGESASNRAVIENYAFYNLSLTKVEYGSNINFTGAHHHSYSSLKSMKCGDNCAIGYLTAYDCTALNTLDIGDNCTIGSRAFDLCLNITSSTGKDYLDLTGVITIADRAFRSNYYNLKEVRFSEKLASIGEYAFSDCGALETVNLVDTSITVIPKACFERTSIESIVIPKDVVTIGNCAFSAYISNGATRSGTEGYYISGSSVSGTPLSKLTTVVFENGSMCSKIGDYAFYRQKINGITFPDYLASIGSYAFYYAGTLREVVLKAPTEMTVGGAAFEGDGINTLEVRATNNFNAGNWAFANNSISTLDIKTTGKVVLGSYCFYQNKGLVELNIYSNECDIGSYCFTMNEGYGGMDADEKIAYPEYQTLTTFNFTGSKMSIGREAFRFNRQLQTVNFYGIKNVSNLYLGQWAFGHADTDAFWTIKEPLLVYDNEGREMSIMIKRGLTYTLGNMATDGPASQFKNGLTYYMGNSYTTELIGTKYPTCTERGCYTYKMTILEGTSSLTGHSYFYFDVPIPALGHLYSDEVFYDADCVYGEYAEKHCIRGCVTHTYGVNDDGLAIDSNGVLITSSCTELNYQVITETESTACLNHEYYAGKLYYRDGVETDSVGYAALGADQKSNYFIRYKHNTSGQIISAYFYGKLDETEQADYTSLYVGTEFLTESEYNKLNPAEQSAYTEKNFGRIVYGDIKVNGGEVSVITQNGPETFTSPFENYIAVYIEYECYRHTHHVLSETELYPSRIAYLPTNLTGDTDQVLGDIPLQLKNLGWADNSTSLEGGNGKRDYTAIYACDGNGIDVFKKVELIVPIMVSRVELSLDAVRLNYLSQSTSVTKKHVTSKNLPTGVSDALNPDSYFDGSTPLSWSDVETRTTALAGRVNYKVQFKNTIYDLVAKTGVGSSGYWVDGIYNVAGINNVANYTNIGNGYTVESVVLDGDYLIVEISHDFELQTPSLKIVKAIADDVTYDGQGHGFVLTSVPASSKVKVTEWTTADSSGIAKTSGYNNEIQLSVPSTGLDITTDLREVEDFSQIKTDAGTYYFQVVVTNDGYSGNIGGSATENTSYTFYVEVVIHRASVAIPAGSSAEFDGSEKTGFAETALYQIKSGDCKATNAGTYNVKLELKDNNYYWEGLSEENRVCDASWFISKMVVKVPTVIESKRQLVYDGSYQTPLNLIPVNTVSGTPKTGDYRTTRQGYNLVVEYYYENAWKTIYILEGAYALNVGSSSIHSMTGFTGLFDTQNLAWPNNATEYKLGDWQITKAIIDNPIVIVPDKEFDGQPYDETEELGGTWNNTTTENGAVFTTTKSGLVFEYYRGKKKLDTVPSSAGVYTVKVNVFNKLRDNNYEFRNVASTGIAYAEGTFEITKQRVTLVCSTSVVDSSAEKPYTGEAQSLPEVGYRDADGNVLNIPEGAVVLKYFKTKATEQEVTEKDPETGLDVTIKKTIYMLDEDDAGTYSAPTFTEIGTYVYMVAIDEMVDNYKSVNYATVVLVITKAEQGISVVKADQNAIPSLVSSGAEYVVTGHLGDDPLVLEVSGEFDKASVLKFGYDSSFGFGSSPVEAKTEAGTGCTLLTVSFNQMTEGAVITVSTEGTKNAGGATTQITVKITKAVPTVVVSSSLIGANASYTGNPIYNFTPTVTGTNCVSLAGILSKVPFTPDTNPSENTTILFYNDIADALAHNSNYTTDAPIAAGQYWAVARYNGDNNYLVGYSAPINVTIGNAELTVNGYSNVEKYYDATSASILAGLTVSGNGSTLTRKYAATTTVGEYYVEYYPNASVEQPEATLEGWTTTCPSVINVASSGTYWFRVVSANYETETRSINITVKKVSVTVSAKSTIQLTRQYDGTDKLYSKTNAESWSVAYSSAIAANAPIVAAEISDITAKAVLLGGKNSQTSGNVSVTYTVVPDGSFDANNYLFNSTSLDSNKQFTDTTSFKGTVTKRELTVTGLSAITRQYDGTKIVNISDAGKTVTGFVTGENITYTYIDSIKGQLSSAVAGLQTVEKYMNGVTPVSDFTTMFIAVPSSGTETSNYTIKYVNFPTVVISVRDTKVDVSKVPTSYTYSGSKITGFNKAEIVTSSATYNTDASSVATDLTTLKSGLVYKFYEHYDGSVLTGSVLSGATYVAPTKAGTYYLQVEFAGNDNFAASKSAVITITVNASASLKVTFDTAKTQWTYDGTSHDFIDMLKEVKGTNADGALTTYVAKFYADSALTKEIEDVKNVKSSGTYYYKVTADNYKVSSGAFAVTISKKNVTITKPTVSETKIYDGTKAVLVTGTPVVSGAVLSEKISATATAEYNSTEVADANTIRITYVVTFTAGADPDNYSYTAGTNATQSFTVDGAKITAYEDIQGSIVQKALSINGIHANTRVYDGTNKIDLVTSTACLNGVVETDSGAVELDFIPTTGIVTNINYSASAKTVIVVWSSATLKGEKAGNYKVTSGATVTVNINKATPEISWIGTLTAGWSGAPVELSYYEALVLGNETPKEELARGSSGITYKFYTNAACTTLFGADGTVAPTDKGTYYVVASYAGSENYVPVVLSSALSVTDTGIYGTDSEIKVENRTFDGKAHNVVSDISVFSDIVGTNGHINITSSSNANVYIALKTDENRPEATSSAWVLAYGYEGNVLMNSSAFAKIKDAGTYTYWVKITADNHADCDYYGDGHYTTITVTIEKATIKLYNEVEKTKVYDGKTKAEFSKSEFSCNVPAANILGIYYSSTANFADKNAGSGKSITIVYTLRFEDGEKASNYNVVGSNGVTLVESGANVYTYTVNGGVIQQKQITIKGVSAIDRIYNNQKTVSLNGTPVSSDAICTNDSGILDDISFELVENSIGTISDAKPGTYSVTVNKNVVSIVDSSADKNNYTIAAVASPSVNIGKKQLSLTFAGETSSSGIAKVGTLTDKTFTNKPMTLSAAEKAVVTEFVSGGATPASVKYTYWTDSSCITPAVTGSAAVAPTNVGTYYVKAEVATDDYYLGTNVVAKITINKANLNVTPKGYTGVYDGTTHTPATFTVKGADGNAITDFTVKFYSDSDRKNEITSVKNYSDSKTYYYTLSYANYEDKLGTVNVSISRIAVSLSGVLTKTKTYTATTSAAIVNPTIKAVASSAYDALINSELSVSAIALYDNKNAGTGKTIKVTYTITSSGALLENYTFNSNTLKATEEVTACTDAVITKKAVTISGAIANAKVYDGNTVGTIKTAGTAVGFIAGDDVTLVTSGATVTFSDANAATGKTVTFAGYTLSGTDAANYELSQPDNGTATIERKNIASAAVVLGDALTYNGLTQYQTISSVTINGLTVTYTVTGSSGINANTYTMTLTGTGNFCGTKDVQFTIAKAKYNMSGISFSDLVLPYDGAAHHMVISGILPTGSDGITVTVSYIGSQQNTGSSAITARFATSSSNYETPDDMTAVMTITTKVIVLKPDNKTKTYGDADPVTSYTVVSGAVITGEELKNIVISRTIGENVGKYTYSIDLAKAVGSNGNYYITVETGELEITAREIVITIGDQTHEYNKAEPWTGRKQTSTAIAYWNVTSGAIQNNGVVSDTKESLNVILTKSAGINVGKYEITGEYNNGNYNVTFVDGEYTITPREITVVIGNAGDKYGNDPKLSDVTLNAKKNGLDDAIANSEISIIRSALTNFKINASKQSTVGSYSITADSKTYGNYKVTTSSGLYTVSKRPITITADTKTKVYDTDTETLTYTIGGDGLVNSDAILVDLSSLMTKTFNVGSTAINVGSVTMNDGTDKTSNYEITKVDGVYTVTPANFLLTFEKGPDLQATVFGTNFRNGIILTNIQSGRIMNAVNGNAFDGTITWSVSSTAIATVDSTGLVTPLKNGNVIVTVTFSGSTNYTIVTESYSYTLAIAPAGSISAQVTPYRGTQELTSEKIDGKFKTINLVEVELLKPTGSYPVKYYYSLDGGNTWSEEIPSSSVVGTYFVTVKIIDEAEQYGEFIVTVQAEITERAKHEVKFVTEKGTINGSSSVFVTDGTYITADKFPTATRKGYKFVGWKNLSTGITKTAEGWVSAKIEVTSALFFEAVYEADTFTAETDSSAYVYTGDKIEPTVIVKSGSSSILVEGVDYKVYYYNNITTGTATVNVVGINDYEGFSAITTFEIVGADISSTATVDYIPYRIYNGKPHTPALLVKVGSTILVEGVDYTVNYSNNVNVGIANVEITFIGNCSGSLKTTFAIMPKAVDMRSELDETEKTYTGSYIYPVVTVTDSTGILEVNKDYTIVYRDSHGNVVTAPKGADTYTVEIVGKGNYEGLLTSNTFTVRKRTTTARFASSTAIKTFGDAAFINELIIDLAGEHGDVVFTSSNPKVATVDSNGMVTIIGKGTAVIVATVASTENTSFAVTSFALTVEKKSASDFIIEQKGNTIYNGEEIQRFITIKDGDKILVEGTDYKVTYENNVNVGSAAVKIEYINNYSGNTTEYFEITPKTNDITAELSTNEVIYNGDIQTPVITVADGSSAMVEGKDYVIVYRNSKGEIVTGPKDADVYTIEIEGIGNYSGTLVSKNFIVKAYTTSSAFVEPTVDKTFGDEVFSNGLIIDLANEHGELTFTSSNSAVATVDEFGNVTIVGIGTTVIKVEIAATNNTTATTAFYTVTVTPKPSTDNTIEISGNMEYTGKEIKPFIVIKDGDKTLTNGYDYDVSYINNVNVGEATVIITYKYNYAGSQQINYTIVPFSSRISVSFSKLSFVYNGKTLVPTVTVKDGETKLTLGKDYTITYTTVTGKTVKNPTDAGAYIVKVTGIGNYTGLLISGTYEITAAPVKASFTEQNVNKTYTDNDFTNPLHLDKTTDGVVIYTSSNPAVATIDSEGKIHIVGIGTTTIKVYVGATNNYQAASAEFTLTVKAKDVANFTVDPIADQKYIGTPIIPRIVVRDGQTILIEGRDYTLSVTDNNAVGKAKVKVTGIGSYSGTINTSFNIVANPYIFELPEIVPVIYDGTTVTINPEVKYAGVVLTEGVDYTLVFHDNDKSGNAYYEVIGSGAYADLTGLGVFEILANEIGSDDSNVQYYITVKNRKGFGGDLHIDARHVEDAETEGKKLPTNATYVAAEENTEIASFTEDELKALCKGKNNLLSLDIRLMSGNVEVTKYEGVYTVRLLIPKELNGAEEIQVTYIGEDGKIEVFDTTVEDGYIIFETTHFSEFQFLGKTRCSCWWWIILICFVLCTTTVIICIVIVKKNNKDEDEKNNTVKANNASSGNE